MQKASTPWIRWLLLLAHGLLALLGATNALAAGYVSSITTAYPQLAINPSAPQINWKASTATCNVPSRYNVCDDGISDVMPIGFSFTFANTAYTKWSMSTNGVIFFETTAALGATSTGATTYVPQDLPTTTVFVGKPALMPFWADLQKNASRSNTVDTNDPRQPIDASFYQYEVQTVAGQQVLVIQLKNVNYWNSGGVFVNMQIQLWSSGAIVYSYGSMAVMTSNPKLRIGLQYPGNGCNILANQQSTSLSGQSYVFTWDPAGSPCPPMPTVNHYEIAHDGAATLCTEPVTVLACTSATTPCPTTNIVNDPSYTGSPQIINASVVVTGTGNLATPTESPPSFNIQPGAPQQSVNLTWAAGTGIPGNATLGLQAAVSTTPTANALTCTNVARTASSTCVMAVANTACVAAPHHFEIQGPASGTTCSASTFTVKAWADAAQTTAYTTGWTGTLTQTGTSASLPNLGAFTIPNGSSTVSITPITWPLAGTTAFGATATPALTGATTCSFGGTTTTCNFAVASCVAGFNCVETTANAAVAADASPSTGRLYTKLAGTAITFDVVARKADGSVDTTWASDTNKVETVELVNGSGTTACASRAALNPVVASQTLTFTTANQPTEQGRKSISFTVPNAYTDVRCRVTDNTNTSLQTCSTDNFAIRPPAIPLVTAVGGPNAPPASGASATPVVKAGASFTLYPANLANTGTNYTGTLTLNTGLLSNPAGGTTVVGTLTPSTLAANPVSLPSNNATYSEVGFLTLAAGAYADNTYTAVDSGATPTADCLVGSFADTAVNGKIGCNVGTAAASLGRFQPAYFTTVVTPGCNGFTYAGSAATPARTGQPFTVVTTAKAIGASNPTTVNFTGAYAKTVTLSNAGVGSGLSGNTIANTGFTNGVGTASNVVYTTASPQTAPVTLTIRATDNDTTPVDSKPTTATPVPGFSPTAEGTSPIRSGRVRIQNAYGSEKLDLPMSLTAEYWTGLGWAINSLDTCSGDAVNGGTLSLASPVFIAAPTGSTLTAANVATNIYAWDSGNPGLSGIGFATAATAMVPTKAALQFKKPPVAGNFNLNLRAPGATKTGSVNIVATVPTWLQFNWLGGAAVSPTLGNATFGIFKSPLIYRRENY